MSARYNGTIGSTSEPTDMSRALARFLRSYPAFAKTGALDVLRATDYARLDKQGHVYLDYTGGGLYAESQLRQYQKLLIGDVFGHPHSQNQASKAMSERIEATRAQVLEFFHAAPEEYEVIFTPNATGALRLVGESYPFGPDGHYLLTFDNHNSVNGIREFARAKGASVSYVALGSPELRVPDDALSQHFSHAVPSAPAPPGAADRPNGGARTRWPSPVCLSGPVQFLRRAARPGVGPTGPGGGLGRAARCGRVRPDEPVGPLQLAPGLRGAVVLQDVRLPDRGRSAARPPAGAGQAAAPLVRRWDFDIFVIACSRNGPLGLLPHPGRGRVRGRDAGLPGHSRHRHRVAVHRLDRHRHYPHPGDVPYGLVAGGAG